MWQTMQHIPTTSLVRSLQRSASSRSAVVIKARSVAAVRYAHHSTDERYLQQSPVPSIHFQSSLPRLPLPKLEDTLQRYLSAVEPLVTADVFAEHKKVVADFQSGEGKKLQEELIAFNKANKHTSYITDAWFDMYLHSRDPLPLNSNPYIGFEMDKNPSKNNQLDRAAVLIHSSVRFMNTLRASLLKPDIYHMDPSKSDTDTFYRRSKWVPGPLRWVYAYMHKAFPLDMSQYGRLFNSTRLPKLGKDELFTDTSGKHIAVLRGGKVFTFDVVHDDGTAKSVDEIKAHLAGIMQGPLKVASNPIGVLTTTDRDTWANVRVTIEADATSNASLKRVDTSLFAVALDDHVASCDEDLSRQMLIGDGRNRWFDKSFTLIVLKNGMAAVNFEHAWGDGVAVLRYVNEVWADSNRTPTPSQTVTPTAPQELQFNVTPALETSIKAAGAAFDKASGDLEFVMKRSPPMGRVQLKQAGVGPDGACQFAFQLGYLRLHGHTASTYESCSTAAFKHGRTETIRPNTVQTHAAARAFLDKDASAQEKLTKFMQANKAHNALTKQAAMGQGFDRHMFMLKKLASDANNTPLIFTDHKCYETLSHIILSTSTLQSPSIMSGGFGPVAHDGFGIGYSLFENELGLHITNYQGNANELLGSIEQAWRELYEVLVANGKLSNAPGA